MLLFLLACQPSEEKDSSTNETGITDTATDSATDTATDTSDSGTTNPAFDAIRAAVAKDLKSSNYATGASVAIWYQGKIVFAEGFGSAHPDHDQPVDADTLFQIGSDTKKLTAIALLQEVDAGKLSLDDTLAKALPDLHFALDSSISSKVTLQHLISHQTDIYDYTPWTNAPDDSDLATIAYGRFAENEHGYAPSGTYWNYSNPNFSLAGLAVEKAEGRPYADVLEEKVLKPLGLDHSYARQTEVEAAGNYATGQGIFFPDGLDSFATFGEDPSYEVRTVEMSEQPDSAFIRPAGLVWSTASDMAKLGAFLIHGDTSVLSDASRLAISAKQVPMYPTLSGQYYGYGLMVFDGFYAGNNNYVNRTLWQHGGNTMTMTSTFFALPDDDFVISVLSNGYGDDFSTTAVTAMLQLVTLPAASDPPVYPPAENLESYVGTWDDPNGIGTITLSYVDDHLEVSVPALTGHKVKSELTAVIKDIFYLNVDGYDYDVTFVDGEDGTPHKYLRNRQFGGTLQSGQAIQHPVRPFYLAPPSPEGRPLLMH